MPIKVQKKDYATIFIGLGGTGKDAILQIKDKFRERLFCDETTHNPRRTAFLVLDGEEVTLHAAAYNVADVARAFIGAGASSIAPELARVVLHVMTTAEPQGALKLIRHVQKTAATMGLTLGDEAAWKAADLTFPWTEAIPSTEYWTQLEKSL